MALRSLPRAALGLALILPLAACGTAQQDPLVTAVRAIASGVLGGGDDAPAGPQLTAATVPPAILAQVQGPLILVETTRLGGTTLMTQVGRNGPDVTWRGPEGFGLTLGEAGLLRSTRGLGFDLMATDVRPTVAALRQHRAGPVDRLMVHVDGEGQELRVVHRCSLSLDGPGRVVIAGTERTLTRMTETCRFDGESYENIYWLDGSGRAVQSYQWVSPRIGHMQITTLRN